jgi:hypothetical protein
MPFAKKDLARTYYHLGSGKSLVFNYSREERRIKN